MTSLIDLYGDGIGKVEYVEHMGSDLSVVNSARVSFGKHKDVMEESDIKLINYLIKHRHTSTLEHCVVTFRFKVPLFVRSQHHRHRTWSYNEISRRYTDYNIELYNPKLYRTQHDSNRQASNEKEFVDGASAHPILGCNVHESVRRFHNVAFNLYNNLLDTGVCREQARGVLPQSMYTEYYGTANLNNILKFIDLRIHKGAQGEIQEVAKAILEITRGLYPLTVEAYEKAKKQ
jgi:thymidylate synthase (FAD)